jgi:hypothetical protein
VSKLKQHIHNESLNSAVPKFGWPLFPHGGVRLESAWYFDNN